MDTLQSEDLYEYLLNKFYNQVSNQPECILSEDDVESYTQKL